MTYQALALTVVLSFAGGWVWRGVYDMWRQPRKPVSVVYGETHYTSASGGTITTHLEPPKLRAVE